MSKRTDSDPARNSDEQFVSGIYKSTQSKMPCKSLDEAVLAMARKRAKSKKPTYLNWLSLSSVAASVLIVSVLYLLVPIEPLYSPSPSQEPANAVPLEMHQTAPGAPSPEQHSVDAVESELEHVIVTGQKVYDLGQQDVLEDDKQVEQEQNYAQEYDLALVKHIEVLKARANSQLQVVLDAQALSRNGSQALTSRNRLAQLNENDTPPPSEPAESSDGISKSTPSEDALTRALFETLLKLKTLDEDFVLDDKYAKVLNDEQRSMLDVK
ncbi:hypothetical protein PN836_005770 [Ningiella sp. W23]|uniref:hypothetical protein n=1 Tax=Ningiella sp. W23 TaxID=3023715 RepID=UPI003757C34F